MIPELNMNVKIEGMPVKVPVVISRPHVHLTPDVIEELFCDHYKLHAATKLGQGAEFSALESVTLIGPRGRLRNVAVIGPPRPVNQIEISRTDADTLGIKVPVRQSGDLIGSPGIILEGPRTRVTLGTGVICAQRHLHMSPADAARLGLEENDRVVVSTTGSHRALQFRDVLVRIAPGYRLELHVDTDEANAAGLRDGDLAILESADKAL